MSYQAGRDVERIEGNIKQLVEKINELEGRIQKLEGKNDSEDTGA